MKVLVLILLVPIYSFNQGFAEQEIMNSGACYLEETADLDGDGDLDLVVSDCESYPSGLIWYENRGVEGIDTRHFIFDTSCGNFSIHSEDLDNDGDNDLFVMGDYNGAISYFINNGAGIFDDPISIVLESGDSFFRDFVDMTDDGKSDLVLRNELGVLCVYERMGIADFVFSHEINKGEAGFAGVVGIDLDLDGDQDYYIMNEFPLSEREVRFIENLGNGEYAPSEYLLPRVVGNKDLFADIDQDGDLDVISEQDANLVWLENVDNSFDLDQAHMVHEDYPGSLFVWFADPDSDGDLDFFTAGLWYDLDFVFYENLGEGSFSPPHIIQSAENGDLNLPGPNGLVVMDVDHDTKLDVIVASALAPGSMWTGHLSVFKNILGNSCTEDAACNYNPVAVYNDNFCCYENCGCTDQSALNYDLSAMCDSSYCFYLLGDQNADGIINIEDLVPFLVAFGHSCGEDFCPGDINGDGFVNVIDLIDFLGIFGQN